MEHCVRAFARIVPALSPRQFEQLQFHCGKPPPAAEPSTWTRTNGRAYDSERFSEADSITGRFGMRTFPVSGSAEL
jgi:hypothetical protein